MDITALPPFSLVACPTCDEKFRVKLEFGPYRLDRRLSTGGMSVLFVARDTLLDREVAVKILNEEYTADQRRITAFEEEARVTASLSHPNIVRVLTTGYAFGRFFIAMELVPGGHFEHQIRVHGKIPEARMLKLAIQIASGLKAAHEAKLIHRDIKPGNILLDADGNAKIVDFGLALVTQGGTVRAKEFWATPYYVPPETVEGAEEDFRSDIYAFGATLYHALAGKPPCNEESMSIDLLRAAKKNIIPLHLAEPELSTGVCEIVDKAMAYHPNNRYATYDDLINDLQDAANRTKHGLKRESAGQAANRRSRARRVRHITLASIGLLGGLTVISTLAWLLSHGDTSAPTTTNDPPESTLPQPDTANLGKTYEDAREAFTNRSYGTAVNYFAELYHNPRVLEPTRTWAGMQAVIAALLDEDGTRARQLSMELASHMAEANPTHPEIAATLVPILHQIHAKEPIAFGSGEPSLSGAPALVAWLLAGIHEWQYGDYTKSATYFKVTLDVTLDEDAQWATILQAAARDHLADLAMLDDPAYRIEPRDLESAIETYNQLESMRSQIRTRGPIIEELRSKLILIGRLREQFASAEEQPEEQPEEQADDDPEISESEEESQDMIDPLTPTQDLPAGAPVNKNAVLELLANYDFIAAREAMLRLDEKEVTLRQRIAWMQVVRSAEKFLESLVQDVENDAIPIHSLRLKSGEILTDIQPHRWRMPADQNGNPISWSDIDVESYIEWHRARIPRIDEPDRIHAHESAISFDLLAGDPARALTAIERLSETDSNFENYWKLILENYPK